MFSLTFLPVAAEWVLALAAGALYFTAWKHTPEENVRLMKRLVMVGVAVFFALALLGTFFQYTVWKGDPLSQNLLPPHQPIGYFAKYAGVHFWLAPLLSSILSVAFYGFLTLLKKKNERFFEEGEMELGALTVFLAGWPRAVVFLPIVFLAVLALSGIKMALRKDAYTTLGFPFLIGLVISLAYGFTILQSLDLEFLAVIPGLR